MLSNAELRVMQVIAPAPFGGAESVVRAFARAHPGQTQLVTLLQHGGPHPFYDEARAEGLPAIPVSCGRRRYDREARAIRDLIREHRPHVLHTHIYHADFVGYAAARREGVPLVTTVHGITGGDRKDRFYQWLDLKLLPRFDAVICVSESVRSRVVAAGCRPERTHVVANPYSAGPTLPRAEARAALGVAGDRAVVGWIGRLSVEKGADLLLRAIAQMTAPRPLFVVVGAGPEEERVKALVAELGVEGDVLLVGNRPNASGLLSAFDALVLSSRTEGLPMVLLEAMGASVPVVAFAVGGIPDAIDATTGWLAPAEDTAALGEAVAAALADPGEAGARAARARERVQQRYGVDAWIDHISRVHRAVIEQRGSGR